VSVAECRALDPESRRKGSAFSLIPILFLSTTSFHLSFFLSFFLSSLVSVQVVPHTYTRNVSTGNECSGEQNNMSFALVE
jgi:hypothetical protein